MKRNLLLIATIISGGFAFGQVTETVSIGAGYANENYYTLNNGNQVSVTRSDWDLAFASNGLGGGNSTIRINGAEGAEMYLYGTDTLQFNAVDTTSFNWSANRLLDSDADWALGVFEDQVPASSFDLGWGTYSPITHIVTGDRIFILKLGTGAYKKLIITNLTSGIYSFQYANLDGSSLVNTSIAKSNYFDKNFGYYSIQNSTALDREPLTNTWDLLFTRYIVDLGVQLQGVTGVLSNVGVKVAQVNNVADVNNVATPNNASFSSNIGTIGWDWKAFDLSTFSWSLDDSLVYFVEDLNQDIYKIVFIGFGGSSNGDIIFTKELIGAVGIEEDALNNEILSVYPNPASTTVNLTFVGSENTQIGLFDVSGKQVFSKTTNVSGLNQETIDVRNLTKGMYFLTLTSESGKTTQKIIIN